MRYLTSRKRVSGKGSAHTGTEHHWSMTLSSVALAFMIPTWVYLFGSALGGDRDAVVAAFPKDPFPLNERFLLHTLNQDPKAACRDIVRANALAKAPVAPATDAILRQDLKLRLASCLPRPGAARQPAAQQPASH